VDEIAAVMNAAFPDAEVLTELVEPDILEAVNATDCHVVVTWLRSCDIADRALM